MAIQFPNLPYALDALAPYISKETLKVHHGKHHRHYVDTLNELIQGTSFDRKSLEEIMDSSCGKNPKIYNNAAQAWNHAFFWKCMAKDAVLPSKDLKKAIAKKFDSLSAFKNEFTEAAKELFGSGWVWLTKDKKGLLRIRSSQNAENPMQDGETPLLTCDVWEHAYYIDYRNSRPNYMSAFWELVNWDFVASNLR